jgi:hypothetical protein
MSAWPKNHVTDQRKSIYAHEDFSIVRTIEHSWTIRIQSRGISSEIYSRGHDVEVLVEAHVHLATSIPRWPTRWKAISSTKHI